jgi:hypothetical protein
VAQLKFPRIKAQTKIFTPGSGLPKKPDGNLINFHYDLGGVLYTQKYGIQVEILEDMFKVLFQASKPYYPPNGGRTIVKVYLNQLL